MARETHGFIGLGNMGGPMARNAAGKGLDLVVHDIAGADGRAPAGAAFAGSNAEVARRAGVVALSLPTVEANRAVVEEIAASAGAGSLVVDTCTIGPEAAEGNAAILERAGIGYLDSPVSGLRARAEEGTLASMTAGDGALVARARPFIESWSRALYHVGPRPGQGQRMKLVNNALCISAYVTTSEALAYGEAGGLDMDAMLEVLNASSGQNFATLRIFPEHVAKGRFDDSGAHAEILRKDLGLFVRNAGRDGTPHVAIAKTLETIKAFAEADPLQDQMRIYPFVRDGGG